MEQSIETIKSRLVRASSPTVSTSDIQVIFGFGIRAAKQLKAKAIKEGGLVPFNSHLVKTESVFKVIGIDQNHSIQLMKKALSESEASS